MNLYSIEAARNLIHPIVFNERERQCETRDQLIAELETQPDIAVQGYDAEGTIFYWNGAAQQMYGYSEQEAIGQNLFDLVLPTEIRPLARAMVKAATKSKDMPDPVSCDLITKSGAIISVYSGHMVLYWGNNTTPEYYCIDLPLAEE